LRARLAFFYQRSVCCEFFRAKFQGPRYFLVRRGNYGTWLANSLRKSFVGEVTTPNFFAPWAPTPINSPQGGGPFFIFLWPGTKNPENSPHGDECGPQTLKDGGILGGGRDFWVPGDFPAKFSLFSKARKKIAKKKFPLRPHKKGGSFSAFEGATAQGGK